ncbi:hydrogenase maturation protease [Marinobacter caseinilyticus]|uniref:hydrogenase maturation protease n=1 Tax=Marinobacter caseinilyticus TaxID=2692195 RepID=UPI00140C6D00|nr:hydrogenase maturation protease [Marinobacter caseinilyticus]
MSNRPGPVRIIGVGNADRGDDAVGLVVAATLRKQRSREFTVLTNDGDIGRLLDCMAGADSVLLVDAARTGATPGSHCFFDVTETPLPPLSGAASSHALGLADGIELARSLGLLPPDCRVCAIEAASFEVGTGLSPAVAATVGSVAEALLSAVATRLQARAGLARHGSTAVTAESRPSACDRPR